MKPWLRAAIGALIAAGLLVGLAFGLTRDPRVLPGVVVGKRAPSFDLRGIDGRRVRLAELRGRPVLLNFWASWCTECKKEHPYLMAAHERWRSRVKFVGVVFKDTPRNIERFLLDRGESPRRSYPNLMDPGSRVAIDFGVYGVPETFFVGRRGTVTYKRIGRLTPELLESQLRRIAG